MEYLFWSLTISVIRICLGFRYSDLGFFLSACLKQLTLCPTIAYEKQTPKFSTIQAIWRTIGAISRVIRDNSRAIREQFETIGAISRQTTKNLPRPCNHQIQPILTKTFL
jgi:hypothetical protein